MLSVNLLDVICTCVKGCLAAQCYIVLELLRVREHFGNTKYGDKPVTIMELDQQSRQKLMDTMLKSLSVNIKSELYYKERSAAKDFVTTADVVTQALLVKLLERQFPDTPFTVIGEEDVLDSSLVTIAQRCVDTYCDPTACIPFEQAFRLHALQYADSTVLRVSSVEELRARIGIYIDPIDATNCFVEGVWEAPMTLVGLAVDGVPIGAVANRIFMHPVGQPATPKSASIKADFSDLACGLSYVYNPAACGVAAPAFMVHEGCQVPTSSLTAALNGAVAMRNDSCLCVCQSSTTKSSFLYEVDQRLQPCVVCYDRGSANKQFFLIDKVLGCSRRPGARHADVFVAPANSIKKWDCCAPHAFLKALGGGLYTQQGVPLHYSHVNGEDARADAFAGLPVGVVATTASASPEVSRRMRWAA